jgi:hypothetical protein
MAAMGAPARRVWAFDRRGTTRTDPSAGTLKGYAARATDVARPDGMRRPLRVRRRAAYLVPGVLGVAQDGVHGGFGPERRHGRRRVDGGVRVEPPDDGWHA